MEHGINNIQSLEDIERLIRDRVEEGPTLDYKSELGSNKDIAKDISAFANTLGGVLVYGVSDVDRIPTGFTWLSDKGIEERIQNVARTAIKPQLRELIVNRFPLGEMSEFVIVVQIPASPEALHMADYRYYKRQGSESIPMEDYEVKTAMFRKGLKFGLLAEVKENSALAKQTLELIEAIYRIAEPKDRGTIAFIPFHNDAWKALLASGLLTSLDDNLIVSLTQAYAIIHEVNALMEWLKIGSPPIVRTPAYASSVRSETYIPAIVRDKVTKLLGLLTKLESSL